MLTFRKITAANIYNFNVDINEFGADVQVCV